MKIKYIFIFLLYTKVSFSQKNDYFIVAGGKSYIGEVYYGGTDINFNFNPPRIYPVWRDYRLDFTLVTANDEKGQFQFYSNGCFLINKNNKIIEGSKPLNPGFLNKEYCDDGYGYPAQQSMVVLPLKDRVIHKSYTLITSPVLEGYTEHIYLTTVDMSLNKGEGKVTKKGQLLIKDTFNFGGITTCKHSNGKDWWLLDLKRYSNTFVRFLLKPDTVLGPFYQSVGPLWLKEAGAGQGCYSHDGKKYARCNEADKVTVYDFDRNSGLLSNAIRLENMPEPDSTPVRGICFSPNNRYLYVSNPLELYQYDLKAESVAQSRALIDQYDKFVAPEDILPSYFGRLWLGPDCRIYSGSLGGVRSLHIIKKPNEAGKACSFEQHAIIMPTKSYYLHANFPNYRLDIAPVCDSTIGLPQVTVAVDDAVLNNYIPVTIAPNPSNGQFNLEIDLKNYPSAYWELYNGLGQRIDRKPLANYDQNYTFDYQNLPKGMYFYTIRYEQKILKQGKVILVE